MSGKADALATQFEQASKTFISNIEQLSDKDWQSKTLPEGWTVAATAHHVAVSPPPIASMAQAAATGGPMPPITMDILNQMNAEHAKNFSGVSREETIALLRDNTKAAAAVVRGLSDEQLAGKAMLPLGMELTAEQIVQNVLVGHLVGHGESIAAVTAK